jgi:hypothetical protein
MRGVHVDHATRYCVYPTAVIAATTWKFQGVEDFVIEHCQKHVAIFRYSLEDEMPHERHVGEIRKIRIDLAQGFCGRKTDASIGPQRGGNDGFDSPV